MSRYDKTKHIASRVLDLRIPQLCPHLIWVLTLKLEPKSQLVWFTEQGIEHALDNNLNLACTVVTVLTRITDNNTCRASYYVTIYCT